MRLTYLLKNTITIMIIATRISTASPATTPPATAGTMSCCCGEGSEGLEVSGEVVGSKTISKQKCMCVQCAIIKMAFRIDKQ